MTRSMRDWKPTDNNGSEASTRSMFRERVRAKQVAGNPPMHTTKRYCGYAWGEDRMEAKDKYKFQRCKQDKTVIATHAITG